MSSAGTEARIQTMLPVVRERLIRHGCDPSPHVQRKLSRALVGPGVQLVAMGLDHQDWISQELGMRVPLYLEFAGHGVKALPDIWEVVADYEGNPKARDAYALEVVETIIRAAPAVAREALG